MPLRVHLRLRVCAHSVQFIIASQLIPAYLFPDPPHDNARMLMQMVNDVALLRLCSRPIIMNIATTVPPRSPAFAAPDQPVSI